MKDIKIIYRTNYGHTGFWIKDALGVLVYFITHDRSLAQNKCDDMFGKGKYTVSNRG